MTQTFRTSSFEQSYKEWILLPPPWQKDDPSYLLNHINDNTKHKLDSLNKDINISTYNRFEILKSTHYSMDATETESSQEKMPLPPPIFINDVIDIQAMIKAIEEVVNKEDYQLKIKNNQVKILPTDPDSYRKLIKVLKVLNAKFYTHQLKQERSFRVLLRNIHYSANLDELKDELQNLGHEVTNINNIKHGITKDPLSLFFVELKRKPNNKEIYNINRLMNSIVKFEPFIKKEIVQCKRCQRYCHTQKYCNLNYCCARCAGPHSTDQCTKSTETPPKCIHCQGDHTANYKGCSVYQTLYNNRYSKIRVKDLTIPISSPQKLSTSISYAEVVQEVQDRPMIHNEQSQNISVSSPQSTNRLDRLEKLIEQQSEQFKSLLSLLTLLVSKVHCDVK
jgi:hypothetical protein